VLEAAFWYVIDACAAQTGRSWAEWVADALSAKPDGIGRASWLRLTALEAALSGGASSATANTTTLAANGRPPRS
jgi:predicted DNA-binding ribbon-helix-helix protein